MTAILIHNKNQGGSTPRLADDLAIEKQAARCAEVIGARREISFARRSAARAEAIRDVQIVSVSSLCPGDTIQTRFKG